MAESKQTLLDFEEHGRITVATVHTARMLSALNVAEFGREIAQYVEKHPGVNLLLDFQNVNYLSSAVLTELLRVKELVENANGRLRLCQVAPPIREVFEITNLDKVFVIHVDGVDANIKRFERALDVAAQSEAWEEPKPKS